MASAIAAMESIGFASAKTGADQWFAIGTGLARDVHRNDESVDDAGGWVRWERTHSRLYHPGRPDRKWGPTTAAPIHHDLPKPSHWLSNCGEVATSFNGPRDDVAAALVDHGRTVTRMRTRERRSVQQCDGSRVAPDGQIVLVG